ncbi:MAG: hypothetical protein WBX01_02695 [Nitrososphaeraceae archaeon]
MSRLCPPPPPTGAIMQIHSKLPNDSNKAIIATMLSVLTTRKDRLADGKISWS